MLTATATTRPGPLHAVLRRPFAAALGVVGLLALVARFAVVTAAGGITNVDSYDAGVYYAASAALVNGRLPYRDYTLLHPPGIALAFSPFALLGKLTTDHLGFMAATVGAMAAGAACAVLVALIVRRAGFGRRGAVLAGLFYAVSWPALASEYLARLEPIGNLFLLLGVLGCVSTSARRPGLLAVAAGVALGAAMSVKIWFVVPVAVVLVFAVGLRRGVRVLGLTIAGTVGALVVVNGPFFLAAPSQMWHAVVLAQVGRPRVFPVDRRLREITGFDAVGVSHGAADALLTVLGVLGVIALAAAARTSAGRFFAALLVAELVVVLASPSWFVFYSDYVAVGAALVLGAAAGGRTRRPDPGRVRVVARRVGVAAVSVAILLAAAAAVVVEHRRPPETFHPFPVSALRPAVAHLRCVQADQPGDLIQLDRLDSDLRHGCQQWVDVTGRLYDVDRRNLPSGRPVAGTLNQAWQRALLHYFGSADAVMITNRYTALSPSTRAALQRGGVLRRAGDVVIYRAPKLGRSGG